MTYSQFNNFSKCNRCAKCNFLIFPTNINDNFRNMTCKINSNKISGSTELFSHYYDTYIYSRVCILNVYFHIDNIARYIAEFIIDDAVCMGCMSTNKNDHAWNGKYGYNLRYNLNENKEIENRWKYFKNNRWWRSAKQYHKQVSTRKKRAGRRCLNMLMEVHIDRYNTVFGAEMGYYIWDIRKAWWSDRPEPHWVIRYRKKTGITYPYLLIDKVVPKLYWNIRRKIAFMILCNFVQH